MSGSHIGDDRQGNPREGTSPSSMSHPDPLRLVEAEFLAPAVIELRRPRAGMVATPCGASRTQREPQGTSLFA
jgi:hypothetical protein